MTMNDTASWRPRERFVSRLSTVGILTSHEASVLAELPFRVHSAPARRDLYIEHQRTDYCSLVVDGVVCRYKAVDGVERQILSLHLPGDVPDLDALQFGANDFSMSAMTPSRIARISHAALRDALAEAPGLNALFWRMTAQDAAITRETVASIGSRTAYERVAHFFCELYVRLQALGLADNGSMPLPLRQTDLADLLGLSAVHINRTIQQLRRDEIIAPRGKRLEFASWPALQKAAGFDPSYLALALPAPVEGMRATN